MSEYIVRISSIALFATHTVCTFSTRTQLSSEESVCVGVHCRTALMCIAALHENSQQMPAARKPHIAGLEGGVQVYLPTLSLSLDLKFKATNLHLE